MRPPRYVLVANPGTPRCEAYRRAVADHWHGAAELTVLPWADVIHGDRSAFDRPAVVRLESAGKNAEVTRLLCGSDADPQRGELHRPAAWFAGFRRVLTELKQTFDARPHLHPTADPFAVAAMFDKNGTLATLRSAGLPVPDFLPLDQMPATPAELFARVRDLGWPTTFVKLNTGSSAVGLVVVRFAPDGTPTGLTSMVWSAGRVFNTRRLRTVGGAGLHARLGFLLAEGATVQRGLPHAQLDGQNADLRVVCLYGRPVATIFRLSPHPVTNLHLGGRRGDWTRCRAAVPTRYWLDALDASAAAAGCFDSAVAGVDVLFEPGFRRHHILEVNAFGDFFPGWVHANGRSLHELELIATAERATMARGLVL